MSQSCYPLLDLYAASNYLGVPLRMAKRLRDERRIPTVKVGRYVRFRQADLDAFISENLRPAVER